MSEEKPPQSWCLNLGGTSNPVAMEFRWIPPGWIRIGQRGQSTDEEPPTWIRIQRGFYMGVLPVTVRQYNALVEKDQQKQEDDHLPATDVAWHQAQNYCREISEQCAAQLLIHGLPYAAALPTEVQWEYACRAGTDTEIVFGDGIGAYQEKVEAAGEADRTSMVWYDEPSGDFEPRDPNSGLPNPFGLRDTHGNVWEWCQDRWDEQLLRRYHQGIDEQQAIELSEQFEDREDHGGKGEFRTRRGGSYYNPAWWCRAACRLRDRAGNSNWGIGLRVCLVPLPDVRPAVRQKEMQADASQADQRRRQAVAGKAEREEAGIQPAATAQPERDFSALIPPQDAVVGPLRTLQSIDGTTWTSNHGPCDWQQLSTLDLDDRKGITKLVVGTPPIQGEEEGRIQSLSLPDSLESLFPNLTHLYLWQIESLQTLPGLPANLQVIDLRGCRKLTEWGDQPHASVWAEHLEEMFLDDTQLPSPDWETVNSFPNLIELSVRGCRQWDSQELGRVISRSPRLRYIDASDCQWVRRIGDMPESLRVLKLNGCRDLNQLPAKLPRRIRRLELRGTSSLNSLPAMPPSIDYLDLRDTISLRQMPVFEWLTSQPVEGPAVIDRWQEDRRDWNEEDWIVQPLTPRPRTLFLHGSRIERPLDIEGEDPDANVSVPVLLNLREKDFVAFRELKVILLGNGRSGKSSLANLWKYGTFDPNQSTTHGIQLWHLKQQLAPYPNDSSIDASMPLANLHVWDFAGQDLYHGTHRLFLENNAIFIVVDSPEDLPGADANSDAREKEQQEQEREWGFGDKPRAIGYWLDMIESLGVHPQTRQKPPVLLVRAKADRTADQGSEGDVPSGVKSISFSAKVVAEALGKIGNPDPMDLAFEQQDYSSDQRLKRGGEEGKDEARQLQAWQEIIGWVREQVRTLLGPFERHAIPYSAFQVVEKLRELTEKNDESYQKHEKKRQADRNDDSICQSPYPHISREVFDGWVREFCPYYGREPQELLKRFHRSGLVYHDERYFETDIVIDQRWAIHGIYTLFQRDGDKSLLAELGRQKGVLTWGELSRCWERNGYPEPAHRLFLRFMKSCGMCFELLTEEESRSGQAILSFPSFYPTREERMKGTDGNRADTIIGQEDLKSLAAKTPIQEMVLQSLSESEVRSILSGLGAVWSRSLEPYRWGCTIRRPGQNRSVFWMDWQASSRQQYSHPGLFRFYGERDERFENRIRQVVEEVLGRSKGWSREEFSRQWSENRIEETQSMREEELKTPEARRLENIGVYVAFSYAGSGGEKTLEGQSVVYKPSPHLGKIPNRVADKLAKVIDEIGYQKVVYYHDLRSDIQQLDKLFSNISIADVLVVFLSRKYLMDSPYCMAELLGAFKEAEACFPPNHVIFFELEEKFDARHSPGMLRRSGPPTWHWIMWRDWWNQKLNKLLGMSQATPATGNLGSSQLDRAQILEQIQSLSQLNEPVIDWWQAVFDHSERPQTLSHLFQQLTNHRQMSPVQLPQAVDDDAIEKQIEEQSTKALEIIKNHLTQNRQEIVEVMQAKATIDAARKSP